MFAVACPNMLPPVAGAAGEYEADPKSPPEVGPALTGDAGEYEGEEKPPEKGPALAAAWPNMAPLATGNCAHCMCC